MEEAKLIQAHQGIQYKYYKQPVHERILHHMKWNGVLYSAVYPVGSRGLLQ